MRPCLARGFNIPQYVIWAKVEVGTPFPGPTVKHIKLVSCTSIVLYYTFLSTCASWITGKNWPGTLLTS